MIKAMGIARQEPTRQKRVGWPITDDMCETRQKTPAPNHPIYFMIKYARSFIELSLVRVDYLSEARGRATGSNDHTIQPNPERRPLIY